MNKYISKIKQLLSMASSKFSIMNLSFTLLGVLLLILCFIAYVAHPELETLIMTIIPLFFSLLLISYSFSKIAEKVLYWTVHLCSILLGLLLLTTAVLLTAALFFDGEWIFTIIFILISSKFYLFNSIKALRKKEKNISDYEQALCALYTMVIFVKANVNYCA